MAAGSITTLPTLPEDSASGAFPPGHFKDPKRLYCKNGGFFLRIHPDGRVDGVREKNDPHIKLQLQAEERGVVSIKGVCANRYLAMKEDGRLLASTHETMWTAPVWRQDEKAEGDRSWLNGHGEYRLERGSVLSH
ncbi:fibroblast growth factor 2 isoform X2 [Loxodonta africana]|uniref:fibroblast growth factor 2 isoform X2 n=1 Tax=Loxodonta africana TaxID=9785 RepID=UPI0030CC35CD